MSKLVSASILSADFANLEKEVKAVIDAGADWIHVDVMDGHFVPNLTIGAPVVAALKKITKAPLDVHLMIERPEKFIDDFAKAGSTYITIHAESTADVAGTLNKIRACGCKAGLTLRPATPVSSLLPHLKSVDMVLIMTVDPGFSGQSFLRDQVDKISEVRRQLDNLKSPALIEVDGGVNDKTVGFCKEADVLVSASFIFNNDYRNSIRILKGTA